MTAAVRLQKVTSAELISKAALGLSGENFEDARNSWSQMRVESLLNGEFATNSIQ